MLVQENLGKFIARVQLFKFSTSVGKSLYVVIPRETREKLGVSEGDYLQLVFKKLNTSDLELEQYLESNGEDR